MCLFIFISDVASICNSTFHCLMRNVIPFRDYKNVWKFIKHWFNTLIIDLVMSVCVRCKWNARYIKGIISNTFHTMREMRIRQSKICRKLNTVFYYTYVDVRGNVFFDISIITFIGLQLTDATKTVAFIWKSHMAYGILQVLKNFTWTSLTPNLEDEALWFWSFRP